MHDMLDGRKLCVYGLTLLVVCRLSPAAAVEWNVLFPRGSVDILQQIDTRSSPAKGWLAVGIQIQIGQ